MCEVLASPCVFLEIKVFSVGMFELSFHNSHEDWNAIPQNTRGMKFLKVTSFSLMKREPPFVSLREKERERESPVQFHAVTGNEELRLHLVAARALHLHVVRAPSKSSWNHIRSPQRGLELHCLLHVVGSLTQMHPS